LWLDAEDSLAAVTGALVGVPVAPHGRQELRIGAVRLPRISNSTDIEALACEPGVLVRWVSEPADLADMDVVVIPGSKATVADLGWLRERGLAGERAIEGRLAPRLEGVRVDGIRRPAFPARQQRPIPPHDGGVRDVPGLAGGEEVLPEAVRHVRPQASVGEALRTGSEATVEVLSLQGSVVQRGQVLLDGHGRGAVDLPGLLAGTYVVRVRTMDGRVFTSKMIRQ
jgi:hypothetical protein